MKYFFQLFIIALIFSAGCSDDQTDPTPDSGSSVSAFSQSVNSSASQSQDSSSAGSSSASVTEITTDDPYTFDGNIAAVRSMITASGGNTNFSLTVTGVVHAVKETGQYWIQDAHAGIFIYYPASGNNPSIGDKIQFTATAAAKFYEIYQITGYTSYSVLSSGNAVYRQTGLPDTSKPSLHQGMAWQAEIQRTDDWNNSTQSVVIDSETGLRARNSTGQTLTAGNYIIRGPIHQTSSYVFADILPEMATRIGDVSSSSSSLAPFTGEPLPAYDKAARIRIGSFNIQIFGMTKISRENTLTALASIATNFEILAVQEVGSNGTPDETTASNVMYSYVSKINSLLSNAPYSWVRGNQYAFVYNTNRVTAGSYGLYNGSQTFAYPPLAAKFTTVSGNFDFVLLTVHTSPTLAVNEIPSLRTAVTETATLYNETDVICLGDFNADGTYFSPGTDGGNLSGWDTPVYTTVVTNGTDTTVSTGNNYTYDRIQLTQSLTEDYTGSFNVLRFGLYYDMRICEGAITTAGTESALSDHYPVWAEFYLNSDTD